MLASTLLRRVRPSTLSVAKRLYTTHEDLPEELQSIHQMCRKFADEELAPNAAKWDKNHEYPKEAISR